MLTDELREQLRTVLKDNPHRGADHLYVAARRDGVEVTRRQLDAFLKKPRSDRAAETDEISAQGLHTIRVGLAMEERILSA